MVKSHDSVKGLRVRNGIVGFCVDKEDQRNYVSTHITPTRVVHVSRR